MVFFFRIGTVPDHVVYSLRCILVPTDLGLMRVLEAICLISHAGGPVASKTWCGHQYRVDRGIRKLLTNIFDTQLRYCMNVLEKCCYVVYDDPFHMLIRYHFLLTPFVLKMKCNSHVCVCTLCCVSLNVM